MSVCSYKFYVIPFYPSNLTGGHTNTERGYLPILAQKLYKELQSEGCEEGCLEGVEVLVSENDRHPLDFV